MTSRSDMQRSGFARERPPRTRTRTPPSHSFCCFTSQTNNGTPVVLLRSDNKSGDDAALLEQMISSAVGTDNGAIEAVTSAPTSTSRLFALLVAGVNRPDVVHAGRQMLPHQMKSPERLTQRRLRNHLHPLARPHCYRAGRGQPRSAHLILMNAPSRVRDP